MINDYCYQVGKKTFTNKLLALRESMTTHQFPKFQYYSNTFDKIDWSVPIELSFQALCDIRAQQLRNQYDYIVLSYSGGTDSHTIWETFKRNKIHIDEILVGYYTQGRTEFKQGMPVESINWIQKNHYDPTTKITPLDRQNPKHTDFFANDDWINLDHPICTLSRFEATIDKDSFWAETHARSSGKKYCYIVGLEKPAVRLENGKWFSYFLDEGNYNQIMGKTDVEPFFSSPHLPELHVKQAQILKKYVGYKLSNLRKAPVAWDSRVDQGNKNPLLQYYEHAFACGRGMEIFDNLWKKQRTSNFAYWDTQVKLSESIIIGKFDVHGLLEKYRDGNRNAVNYVNGLFNLMGDQTFYQWLINNGWTKSGENPLKLAGISSKFYYLGQNENNDC